MQLQFHDKVGITGKRKLADGRLVVDARFARAGIYDYAGSEVGRPELDSVRVYRPPTEVFAEDAMASFAHRAVTDDHPAEMVDAGNWSRFSKGFTGDRVARDGGFVTVPMMIADAELIAKVDSGKSELSAGYGAELSFEVGTTPEGEHYDAIMSTIRGNHVAVVDKGRAGAECSIADSDFEGADDMNANTTPTKTIHFDGLPVIVTDAAESVIVKLQGMLADAGKALEKAVADHAAAIAAKDAELGTKDATIADLTAKVITGDALDLLVVERTGLVADAKLIAADLETKGLDNGALRRAAVVKLVGDKAVEGKSDDYVSALFDASVAKAKEANDNGGGQQQQQQTDAGAGLAAALGGTLPGGGGTGGGEGRQPMTGQDAYNKSVARSRDAWTNPDKEADAA